MHFSGGAVREAADDENDTRRKDDLPLELKLQLIGERPSGETGPISIVELAQRHARLRFTPPPRPGFDRFERSYFFRPTAITLGGGVLKEFPQRLMKV